MTTKPFSIVTEYYANGSLFHFMRAYELRDEDYKKIYRGVAKGLYHLHTEGIIHRDLAARNILVSKMKLVFSLA